MIQKLWNSFRHSWHGLKHAYRTELSFRLEVWAGIILVGVGCWAWPLKVYEVLFLGLSYVLILALELFNTALERAFERLHPEHHELVGMSKDLASGAVLVVVLFAGIVAASIIFVRL